MPVDSLLDIARRACMKHSRSITDIGGAPYELLRPILLKIENPEQLYTLEQNSPQIIGKDRELWLNMIKRDIPNYESRPHEPSDPKNWWKVYRKLKREVEKELAAGDERLKAALNNINQKEQKPLTIVSRSQMPKSPITRRQQMAYNYMSGKTGSKGSHKMSLLEKIRKEGKDVSSAKMSRPMHELQKRSSTVHKAPQSFLRDIKQQNLAKIPLSEAREVMGQARTKRPEVPGHTSGSSYDLVTDREARLKALKSGRGRPGGDGRTESVRKDVNHLTLDFLEDDEEDDLFEDNTRSKNGAKAIVSSRGPPPKRKDAPNMFISHQNAKRPRPNGGLV